MFRQEKAVLPYNEISHLPIDSLRFATNLRKDKATELAEAGKTEQNIAAAAAAKVMQDSVQGRRSSNNDHFAVKDTGCINGLCIKVNIAYANEYQEVSTHFTQTQKFINIDLIFRYCFARHLLYFE